jgi:hypothetical protein
MPKTVRKAHTRKVTTKTHGASTQTKTVKVRRTTVKKS